MPLHHAIWRVGEQPAPLVAPAINEVGVFGNQNTVCQPTTPKWRHTVERLKLAFQNWAT